MAADGWCADCAGELDDTDICHDCGYDAKQDMQHFRRMAFNETGVPVDYLGGQYLCEGTAEFVVH